MLGIFRYKFWKLNLIVIIVIYMTCELHPDSKEKDERSRYPFT